MKEFFNKDITIKIISVITAIFVWLLVLNTSNPYETATFTSIPITVENEDFLAENDYVLKNRYKTSMDITIRGRRDVIRRVKDSDFEAILDFSKVKSVEDKYVTINGPFCNVEDVEIVYYNPEVVDIVLSRTQNKVFPVTLETNVAAKQGYKVVSITPKLDTVTLEGEETYINSVEKVVATLDLKDVDKDVTKMAKCKVVDWQGEVVTTLGKDLEVELSIKVARQVAVELVTKGEPAENAVEVARSVTPSMVFVMSDDSNLANLGSVKTEVLDIEGADSSVNATSKLVLPEGVRMAPGFSASVQAYIVIEKIINKSVVLGAEDIKMSDAAGDDSLAHKIKDDDYTILLKGRQTLAAGITPDSLKPSVSVDGLEEGLHSVEIKLVLPPEITQTEKAYAVVEVTRLQTANP